MRQILFKAEHIGYTVSGLLVIAGRVDKDSLDFKAGDTIILVKPDESEIETQAVIADRSKVRNFLVHTVLVEDLKREDVPIGTEVFLKA